MKDLPKKKHGRIERVVQEQIGWKQECVTKRDADLQTRTCDLHKTFERRTAANWVNLWDRPECRVETVQSKHMKVAKETHRKRAALDALRF